MDICSWHVYIQIMQIYTNNITQMLDVDSVEGGVVHVWAQDIWDLPEHSIRFAYEPKIVLENCSI